MMIFFFFGTGVFFCIKILFLENIVATTKHKYSRDMKYLKRGESEKKYIENSQTKMADRNTRTKKQWRYRTIGKQKIKWHN